jgi:hypothetical protein
MLTELGVIVLPLVPLLVLLGFLLLGRFPGEEAIARLSRRLSAGAPRPRHEMAIGAVPRPGVRGTAVAC